MTMIYVAVVGTEYTDVVVAAVCAILGLDPDLLQVEIIPELRDVLLRQAAGVKIPAVDLLVYPSSRFLNEIEAEAYLIAAQAKALLMLDVAGGWNHATIHKHVATVRIRQMTGTDYHRAQFVQAAAGSHWPSSLVAV